MVTVNVPNAPTVNVVASPLVNVGRSRTSRVNCWVSLPTELVAVSWNVVLPLLVGVPPSVAVPSPLSTRVIPAGSAPCTVIDGPGNPVVVTVKEPGSPTSNVAEPSLVMRGFSCTVSVNVCCAAVPTPLEAVRLRL